jgi:predicted ATPase
LPARAAIEEVFVAPPLATPDLERLPGLAELRRVPSVALFEARARAARPEWRLREANARLIAEACVRLDGLPLAIELAAPWTRALSPEQLLGRLSLGFLATGGRAVPARHRTLEAAIGTLMHPDNCRAASLCRHAPPHSNHTETERYRDYVLRRGCGDRNREAGGMHR